MSNLQSTKYLHAHCTISNCRELSSSSIHTIEDGAFEGLDNLLDLDLSHNDITSLQDDVFLNMPLLEVL